MSLNLSKRLALLEAQASPGDQPSPLHPIRRLLDVLVAYHLGEIGENESIAAGMARGLGYESAGDLRVALSASEDPSKPEGYNARWQAALRRLLALKGTPPDCDSGTFGATLEALFAEMPDSLKRHPFLSPDDGFPDAIYDALL